MMDESPVAFLDWLYGLEREDQLSICMFEPFTRTASFASNAEAAAYAQTLDSQNAQGVYFRLATLPLDWTPRKPGARGEAEESAYVYALAADLDLEGPGHVAKKLPYPDNHEDLERLLEKAGLPEPSAWLHSGGGEYPIWKFAERVPAGEAATLSARWHRHLIEWSKFMGWAMDNTSDIARVYRLPGTHNRKPGRDDQPLCTVTRSNGPLYEIEVLTAKLAEAPTAPGVAPIAPPPPRDVGVAPTSQLFMQASEATAPPRQRRNEEYTDAAALEWLGRQIETLKYKLGHEGVWVAMSGFTLSCLHFEKDFPHLMKREAIIAEIGKAAREVHDWEELDAADMEKINRTFNDWDSGKIEAKFPGEAWTAKRVAPDTPAAEDDVDALIAEMLTADQMQDRPAPQYLIKGILNLDSEAWTIGEPGCKKSFVVLDQAVHIVRGMPWRGLKVSQGPVVMIVAEGAGGMSTRIKAYQQEYGRIGDGLYMLPRPVQASNAGAWKVLAAACARLKAVMVVIDTQARVTVGLKENDATDMGIYVDAVRIMREVTQACVHTIHHTGRNGGDARGSSAIDGAQGTELKVIRTGPYAGTLHVEKQKDMEEAPDISLHFKKVTVGVDEDGDDITSLVLIESNAFMDAAGSDAPIERGQEITLPEPEAWTMQVYDHNRGENVRRILTIVQHLAGEHGLTETKVQRALLSRWYEGRPMKAKKVGHLDPETWAGSWTRALDLRAANGDRIIDQIEGAARYWIHPDFLSELG